MKWFLCAVILLTIVACSNKKNATPETAVVTETATVAETATVPGTSAVVPTPSPFPAWHPCFDGSCTPAPVAATKPVCTSYLSLDSLVDIVKNDKFQRFEANHEADFRVNWAVFSWKTKDKSSNEFTSNGNSAYSIKFHKTSNTLPALPLVAGSWGNNVFCGSLCGDSNRFEKPFDVTYQSLKDWLLKILKGKLQGCGQSLATYPGFAITSTIPGLPSSYTYYLIEHENGDSFVISPDLPIELNPVVATVWTKKIADGKTEWKRTQTFLSKWTKIPIYPKVPGGDVIIGNPENMSRGRLFTDFPKIYRDDWE